MELTNFLRKISAACMLTIAASGAMAANTVQTNTSTVTTAVKVTTNVDYVLTNQTPFYGNSAQLDITSTDHAVLIFKSIRPSEVLSKWLKYVKIKGETAVDGVNCQVKMYAQGTIVMPYASDIKPLTCYTEKYFAGSSSSDYGMGNTGGYMNTLTDAQLNNKIRSFKLKRGYMVTFAVGKAGWGYSRCFIADKEDLELSSLPNVLDGKISSYRIFKWNDAQKKGLAADLTPGTNAALKSSWSYTWGVGNSMGPDVECVPHHIKEGWPSIADIGRQNFSPHAKTNNEPANNSDESPASVNDVLAAWQDLMRTGLRLCSPSTHDGGYGWLKDFMTAIDERGWRCDILDMHGYWTAGAFNNLSYYYNTYKRPIWISEMLWGSSWNKDGIFTVSNWDSNSSSNQIANLNGMKPILQNLNNWDYVERYAMWNGERACSKVYHDGSLTELGRFYASMEPGIGYKRAYEFVPKVVIKAPTINDIVFMDDLVMIEWSDPNGDMVDKIEVQYKKGDAATWSVLSSVTPMDKTDGRDVSYSEMFPLENADAYTYRIVDTADGKEYSTGAIIQSSGWISSIPDNYEDFYYMIYSQEASTDLCWAVENNDVYYKTPAPIGTDMSQIWQIEPNGSSKGYSFRNLSTYDYLMCSPNSWNFVTNNASYHVSAAATGYLPEFHSGGFWTVSNCNHSGNYVGLWDDDKQFGVGERLAGNRNSISAADHLKIYAIKKVEFNQKRMVEFGYKDANYTFANPNLTWGVDGDMKNSNGAAYHPKGWTFVTDVSGWNDCFVGTGTMSTGKTASVVNAWAGTINRIEMMQTVKNLPNGVYKLTAELATTNDYPRTKTKTAIYGNPSNWSNISRSYNLVGKGDNTFSLYSCYVIVDNNVLTIGVRSDGTWLKFGDFNLSYVCAVNESDDAVKGYIDNGRALQTQCWNMDAQWMDLSAYPNCRNIQIDQTPENAMIKLAATATVDEAYNSKNVIIGDECKNFVIVDESPLVIESPFVAKKLTYTRNDAANAWHELFVPFRLPSSSGVTTAKISSIAGGTLYYEDKPAEANTPSLVKFSNNTIVANDVDVAVTEEYNSELLHGYYLSGKSASPLRWCTDDGRMLSAFSMEKVQTFVLGDVNVDGNVNILDVTQLVKIILGELTDENGTADVNGDGIVSIADIATLIDMILK